MSYKDLQKRASELGIQAVGVSAEDLEKAIKEAEKADSKDSSEEKKESPKYNAAAVLDGSREVRRYTLDIHGIKFADLAEQFAGKRGFKVELVDVKPGITCPNCGHVFNP